MQLTSSILLFALGASSVSAAVTPRHQRHQKFHEKKAVGDTVTATIDGVVVNWINEYDGGATAAAQPNGIAPAAVAAPAQPTAAPAAAPATSPVVAAEGASSNTQSAGNSNSISSYKPFCAPSTGSKVKRATTAQIFYKGNVGSTWGCNFQLVDSSIADQYDYTMKFTSQSSKDQKCVCWNKIGKDGLLDGFFGESAVSFDLPVGSTQVVATDANTQGGCACGPGSVPKNSIGAWSATWLEMDMANESNGKNSGADVSALMPQQYGSFVQGMQVCAQGQCSSLNDHASNVKAAYIAGMEAADGVGLNLPPGKVALDVLIDYQG